MVLKWMFKKRLTTAVNQHVATAEQSLKKYRNNLLRSNQAGRTKFADAFASLVNDTAYKFDITPMAALYGDMLTWRQLGDALDDWVVSMDAAGRLSENTYSEVARNEGLVMLAAILLLTSVYQLKYDQQNTPELSSSEVSFYYHNTTRLAQVLWDYSNTKISDEALLVFAHELEVN